MKRRGKRKMKRRALIMGVAMATTVAGSAFAKGSGGANQDPHPYSGWGGRRLSAPAGPSGTVDDKTASLLARLKDMLGGLSYRADTPTVYAPPSEWHVELLHNAGVDPGDDVDPRLAGEKFLGLALRFSF
jgi:hypothetical protein